MKIGLLAMSGVRAHDPELLRLGLTLPGFVQRSKVIASLPSLGLLYLAACTPDGEEVHYYEAEGDLKEPADVYTCDLVAISTFSAQVKEAYAIADRLRARGVRVAMGGLHVSVRPEEALEHANFVVIGEGENVWPHVVDAVARGLLTGLFNAADYPPVDVARLPVPRYDLLDAERYNRFTVQTSRGCPWRCEFCASNVMLGKPYRQRPVDAVMRDIEAIRRISRRPFIEFADDNTFVNKRWGKDLCEALIPQRLKWFTETDISVADDDELLALIKRAGCRQLLIGLESPREGDLRGVETRRDFKALRARDYADAIRRIQSHGITVNGCFVLGLDEHTPEIFEQVRRFVVESDLYEVQITVETPFPGTPLYDRLAHEGRLAEHEAWEKCTLFDVTFHPKHMSREDLREGLRWLSKRLYSHRAVRERRRRFHHQFQLHARERRESGVVR